MTPRKSPPQRIGEFFAKQGFYFKFNGEITAIIFFNGKSGEGKTVLAFEVARAISLFGFKEVQKLISTI